MLAVFSILLCLLNLGFCANLLFFIKSFLYLRRFQVHIGPTSSDFYFQEEGVPQGSVLSIILLSRDQCS